MCPTGWERDNIVIPAPLIQPEGPGPPARHWEQDVPPPRKQEVLKCPYQRTRRHSIYGSSLGSSNWLKTKLITFPLPKPGFFSCFHYFSQNQHHPHSLQFRKLEGILAPSPHAPFLIYCQILSCRVHHSNPSPAVHVFPQCPSQTIIIPNQDNHTYS